MRLVTAPEELPGEGEIAVFLAGGISFCPDWQQEVTELLAEDPLLAPYAVLNPRRRIWDIDAPEEIARGQIVWEYAALHRAEAIAFWFPAESICPIALFELGSWLVSDKPLVLGAAPTYPRRFDLQVQSGLARPGLGIRRTLVEVADAIEDAVRKLAAA
jgi:hypothetical protein